MIDIDSVYLAIDKFNSDDPHKEEYEDQQHPKSRLYGQRMTAELDRVAPESSLAIKIACRAQHIGRWMIPRDSFPMDRVGYLKWRSDLKKLHAEQISSILTDHEADEDLIERVRYIIQKKNMKNDPESQLLEDVVCLVFLQFYFEEFAKQHPEEKVISILQKTWGRMSSFGQEKALQLELSPYTTEMVGKALA